MKKNIIIIIFIIIGLLIIYNFRDHNQKRAFYKQLEMPLSKAYSFTSKMMTLNMMARDAKEGISAFIEKRKPNWKNK